MQSKHKCETPSQNMLQSKLQNKQSFKIRQGFGIFTVFTYGRFCTIPRYEIYGRFLPCSYHAPITTSNQNFSPRHLPHFQIADREQKQLPRQHQPSAASSISQRTARPSLVNQCHGTVHCLRLLLHANMHHYRDLLRCCGNSIRAVSVFAIFEAKFAHAVDDTLSGLAHMCFSLPQLSLQFQNTPNLFILSWGCPIQQQFLTFAGLGPFRKVDCQGGIH